MSVLRINYPHGPNTWGLPRPLTQADATWVATNRIIRRAYHADRQDPLRKGMPTMDAMRAAARRVVGEKQA